jgi:ubiquinone/menaquinone biosynthesis C-methylase UbiE
MNLIRRIHGQTESQPDSNHSHQHKTPFWVRYYDIVVNIVTLGKTRAMHQQTLSLVDLQPGDDILDIGCGTGLLLLAAEERVGNAGHLVGLDVESAMIEQAKRRAARKNSRALFEVASIEHIPYANASFDVAFSTLMYHHLTEPQRKMAFDELTRVLRPGGRIVLVDVNPKRRSIVTSLPGHNRLKQDDFVQSEVADRMRDAGLMVVQTGSHPAKQLSYAIGRKEIS